MQGRYLSLQTGVLFVAVFLFLFPHVVFSITPFKDVSLNSQQAEQPLRSKANPLKALDAQSLEMSLTYAGSALWQGTNRATGSGNYAYTYPLFGLQVIDISVPNSPTVIAEVYYPATATDIVIDGDYLYVTLGKDGMLIFDITTPSSPVLASVVSIEGLSSWGEPNAYDVKIAGNYAYISAGMSFFIVDISNPYLPNIISYFEPEGYAASVVISGDYAYIASGFSLEIWDISDPMAPIFLNKLPCGGAVSDVTISGDYVYVVNSDSGLYVIDASNPPNLFQIATWLNTTNSYTEIEVAGNYLYLSNPSIISTIDVSNPSLPIYVTDWPTTNPIKGLYLSDNRAYVPTWLVGLDIYDISSPEIPVLETIYETPGMGYAQVISGNYAYEANGTTGLQVVDISDPENLVVVSSYETPGYTRAIDFKDDFVYITNDSIGVLVINVSDPSNPYLVGTSPGQGVIYDIVVEGNYAYITNDDSGLQVIDISDPQAPFETGRITILRSRFVAIQNGYAYLSTINNVMHVIDISDPTSPVSMGSYSATHCGGIAVSGNYVYLSNGAEGIISIIDISNPANPQWVSDFSDVPIEFARHMTVVGDYLYVAGYFDGLKILNISNPENPILAGQYTTYPGWAWDVDVVGGNVYVTCDNGFLSLWQDGCYGPDGIGVFNVADLSFMVSYFFQGGPAPQPLRFGDMDCDEGVDVGDLSYLVAFLFTSGPPPCGGCF